MTSSTNPAGSSMQEEDRSGGEDTLLEHGLSNPPCKGMSDCNIDADLVCDCSISSFATKCIIRSQMRQPVSLIVPLTSDTRRYFGHRSVIPYCYRDPYSALIGRPKLSTCLY